MYRDPIWPYVVLVLDGIGIVVLVAYMLFLVVIL